MSKLTREKNLRFMPPAAKYLKKLKDKKLKESYQQAIDRILENPFVAEEKTGDLRGIRSYDIYYAKTNYELSYTIEYVQVKGEDEPQMIVVIMCGTRENFYNEIKRYLK